MIVDGADPEVPNHVLARGHADAPDIDCLVRVKGKNLHAGDLVRVKVTGADGYDLVGRALGAGNGQTHGEHDGLPRTPRTAGLQPAQPAHRQPVRPGASSCSS